jgi:FkbM family methyltransferase
LIISPHSRKIIQLYDSIPKPRGPRIYKIANNVSIELDLSQPGERAISFAAFEPIITKRFLDIIKRDDIVLDIGAWIGYYTLLAAKEVGQSGKVISVEPHKGNYDRLSRNVNINGFGNVIFLNLAVGKETANTILADGSDSLTHRIVDEGRGTNIRTESLDTIISALGLDIINLVIMDIEGYEYNALLGANNALRQGIIRNIICEIHPDKLKLNGSSDIELLKFLSALGYKVHKFTDMVNVYHIQVSK